MSSREHEHLSDLTQLRFLVIDEADRMVTQGSFPQLTSILENIREANPSLEDILEDVDDSSQDDDDELRLRSLPGVKGESKVAMLNDNILKMIKQQSTGAELALPDSDDESQLSDVEVHSTTSQKSNSSDENEVVKRQTFIFSATLTLFPSSQDTTNIKDPRRKKQDKIPVALAEILDKVGAQGETKVVDLSNSFVKNPLSKSKEHQKDAAPTTARREFNLPPGLSLYQIRCTQRHKDSHLYSFLTTTKQGNAGPCLVFCNSVGAVKRVGETLKTLGLPTRMLHAHMQQKARLGAMESLSKRNARSVVIATDVAARGLDIPAVATVIHYDVPRAADLFVHRAGRTARGMGENAIGWSVSLISAAEDKNHRFICESILGEGKRQFDEAPMDGRLLSSAQERVNLASKIVSHSDIELKTNKHNQWFINAAKEAELDLEDDMLDDDIINKGDQKIG